VALFGDISSDSNVAVTMVIAEMAVGAAAQHKASTKGPDCARLPCQPWQRMLSPWRAVVVVVVVVKVEVLSGDCIRQYDPNTCGCLGI
jgi:hypothetical protein